VQVSWSGEILGSAMSTQTHPRALLYSAAQDVLFGLGIVPGWSAETSAEHAASHALFEHRTLHLAELAVQLWFMR
jgi:hypothetical protein